MICEKTRNDIKPKILPRSVLVWTCTANCSDQRFWYSHVVEDAKQWPIIMQHQHIPGTKIFKKRKKTIILLNSNYIIYISVDVCRKPMRNFMELFSVAMKKLWRTMFQTSK